MAHMRVGGPRDAGHGDREDDADDEDEEREFGDAAGSRPAAQPPSSSSQEHSQMLVNAMLATWNSTNEAGAASSHAMHPTRTRIPTLLVLQLSSWVPQPAVSL